MNNKKTYILLTCVVLISLFLCTHSFAQGSRLETDLPTTELLTTESDVSAYIQQIITLLSTIAGIVAFFSLAYGGFLWVTSAGEPLKIKESKKRILHALTGLVLVFGAYTIGNSIDPSTVTLIEVNWEFAENFDDSGVYISLSNTFYEGDDELEERMENVRKLTRSERTIGSFVDDQEIQTVRIVNPDADERDNFYTAVVLHGEHDFKGRCTVIYNSTEGGSVEKSINLPVRSVSVIRVNTRQGDAYGYVSAYERPNFDGENQELNKIQESFAPLNENLGAGPFSINIEGSYAVILASGDSWDAMNDGCAIFVRSRPIPSLIDHPMNTCDPTFLGRFRAGYRSCATHYALFPLFESR